MTRKTIFILFSLFAAVLAKCGPPFETDDPEPVEFQHWEVYLASEFEHGSSDASGTLPHIEVNYGVIPNLQLHVIAPFAFDAPSGSMRQYGYGDTELGAKFRFVQETPDLPQVAVFPLVELPTGDSARGLGTGHAQVFMPVWMQKSSGPWTTYGGGGYWINPGPGNRNWWFAGLLVQRQVLPDLAIGAEIFHETAKTAGGQSDTRANVGLIWDLSDRWHFLASAGPVVEGPPGYQTYTAFQLTFGPGK